MSPKEDLRRLVHYAELRDLMAEEHPLLLVEVSRAAWRYEVLEPLRRIAAETLSGPDPEARPAEHSQRQELAAMMRHESLPAQDDSEDC